MEFSKGKTFNQKSYQKADSTDDLHELDDHGMLKGKRDPYFETYSMQFYQDMFAENPSGFFNFFFENNHVLRKLDDEDYVALMSRAVENREAKINGFYIGLAATIVGQLIWKKTLPKIQTRLFRPVIFLGKWLLPPFIGYGIADVVTDIEPDFLEAAKKYNFQFEDYKDAMEIFELARQQKKLDELLKRGIHNVDIKGVVLEEGKPKLLNPRDEL